MVIAEIAELVAIEAIATVKAKMLDKEELGAPDNFFVDVAFVESSAQLNP